MDLNDYEPYCCESAKCREESTRITLLNTYYYKPSEVPKTCPKCGQETLARLARICLVYGTKKGKFKASEKAQIQSRVTHWTYYCGRSNDLHNKHHICQHTLAPSAATCPECISKYNQMLELANNLLRVRS